MTEPTTMSLNTAEWRGLVLVGTQQLHAFVSGVEVPTAEQVQGMFQHIDRMKVQMRCWQASAPAPTAEAPAATQSGNGAVKGRGWPKGKPRKPRAEQQAVQ